MGGNPHPWPNVKVTMEWTDEYLIVTVGDGPPVKIPLPKSDEH